MSTPSNVHVSTHPCVRAKLSLLRSASTNAKLVESLIHEIATIVGSEALATSLEVQESGTDKSPLGYSYPTHSIPTSISLVPILRSGLSMVSALQSLLPQPVPVHHLGLYRENLQPVEYYNNLPYHSSSTTSSASSSTSAGPSELAIIVDPIIATGQTVCAAIETLKEWGVKRIIAISVLATEEGLRTAGEAGKDGVEFWVGGVDAEMDERGMIKPGLGDVGDRLFGTGGR